MQMLQPVAPSNSSCCFSSVNFNKLFWWNTYYQRVLWSPPGGEEREPGKQHCWHSLDLRVLLANVRFGPNGTQAAKQWEIRDCVPTSLQRPVPTNIPQALDCMLWADRLQTTGRGGFCVYTDDAWCSNGIKVDGHILQNVKKENHIIIIRPILFMLFTFSRTQIQKMYFISYSLLI